jgi:hypothetical protein
VLRSGVTCYLLGVLYACTLVYGCRRLFVLRWSRTQRTIDTPLLFVASIVCALLVRFMSFLNLSVLAYEGVTVEAQTGPPLQSAQAFFSSVLAVFFNVGDWIAISSYLLLIVVWLELMQHARKHFYSQMRMRCVLCFVQETQMTRVGDAAFVYWQHVLLMRNLVQTQRPHRLFDFKHGNVDIATGVSQPQLLCGDFVRSALCIIFASLQAVRWRVYRTKQ